MKNTGLRIVPISLEEANEFVRLHHRHHDPVPGHKFSLAVSDGTKIVGVAIVGRPVARRLDNGWNLEVNRTCTDGTRNANSKLYGAAWRIAKEMGYSGMVTYNLPEEGGASLRAAGWTCTGEAGGGSWSCQSRPRVDHHPLDTKYRWQVGVIVDGKQKRREDDTASVAVGSPQESLSESLF
jgi:hypothetical protein